MTPTPATVELRELLDALARTYALALDAQALDDLTADLDLGAPDLDTLGALWHEAEVDPSDAASAAYAAELDAATRLAAAYRLAARTRRGIPA